jgi:hypothetical protein
MKSLKKLLHHMRRNNQLSRYGFALLSNLGRDNPWADAQNAIVNIPIVHLYLMPESAETARSLVGLRSP